MRECKMIRGSNGRLVPVLPTGESIPGIARDSIQYIQDDERFKRAGLVRVQLELLIWEKDIEGGIPVTHNEDKGLYVKVVGKANFWFALALLCNELGLKSIARYISKNKSLSTVKVVK